MELPHMAADLKAEHEHQERLAEIEAGARNHESDNAVKVAETLAAPDEPKLDAYREEHERVHVATNARLDKHEALHADHEARLRLIEDALMEAYEAPEETVAEQLPGEPTPEPVETEEQAPEKKNSAKVKRGNLYL